MKKHSYTAITFSGLEDVLAQELKDIGAFNIKILPKAVSYTGDKILLYKSNYLLRTALRILMPLTTSKIKNDKQLYNFVRSIDWEKYFSINETISIDATINSQYFNHSKYVALKSKDAIVDYFRAKSGNRPSVDTKYPDIKINIYIKSDNCTISLDSSGIPLNRRGYRINTMEAPINEVLAAGLILKSGWDAKSIFIDPMCGSGTIPIEAALFANNIAPGSLRKKFAFMNWKDYDQLLWNRVINKTNIHRKDSQNIIIGMDKSKYAINVFKENIKAAKLTGKIKTITTDFFEYSPENLQNGIIIFNPPYDKRLKEDDINSFYKNIGDTLKQKYQNFDAWIISSNIEALKHIGLRTSKKITLQNGALTSKFCKYSLYQGSKKSKYNK